MNKKYILWDVDGTLLDFKKSEEYAIKHCYEKFGLTLLEDTISTYSQINDKYWKMLERGEITKSELLFKRFEELFTYYKIEGKDPKEFQSEYKHALGSVFYFLDDSLQLTKRLKSLQFKQYIVTNGLAYTQMKKLKLATFDQVMEYMFVSETMGAVKPQKEYFDIIFHHIEDFDKDHYIIIGDSLTSDIKGGSDYGITTVWYNPDGIKNNTDIRPSYEIKHLKELEKILGLFY